MSRIPSPTEQALQALKPVGLDDAFLARLTACAEETDTSLTADENLFESRMHALAPRSVPATMNAKLMETIGETPFYVDDKIVLFNKSSSLTANANGRKKNNILRFNIAAAAAVALLGALAAFMMPGAKTGKRSTADNAPVIESVRPPAALSSNFAPASYNNSLSDTRDEGVVWRDGKQPHRVMRFTYMDKVTMKNEKGETIQVEQPRYEYVLVPEKID